MDILIESERKSADGQLEYETELFKRWTTAINRRKEHGEWGEACVSRQQCVYQEPEVGAVECYKNWRFKCVPVNEQFHRAARQL